MHDPRLPDSKRGTLDDSFTLNIDLAATILGAAGLPRSPHMQGRDIADLYLGPSINSESDSTWRSDFFYEFPLEEFPASTALITRKWKYMRYPTESYELLFDLENDPFELNDLSHSEDAQAVLDELRQRHDQLKEEVTTAEGYEVPKCEKK